MYPQITIRKLFENPLLRFQVDAPAPGSPSQSRLESFGLSILSDFIPQHIAGFGHSDGTGGIQDIRFDGLPLLKEVFDFVFELRPQGACPGILKSRSAEKGRKFVLLLDFFEGQSRFNQATQKPEHLKHHVQEPGLRRVLVTELL